MAAYMTPITSFELEAIKDAAMESPEKLENVMHVIARNRFEEGMRTGKNEMKSDLLNGLGEMFMNL